MNTKLLPLVQALGLRPAFWSRFTFVDKQTWWDERASWAGSIRRLVWTAPPLFAIHAQTKIVIDESTKLVVNAHDAALLEARRVLDAQPVPMEDREIR